MIDELAVRNLGLIADAHLELRRGLVVVTGETGAGKTMLLGALRLLGGATARSDLVGPGGDEARVEGRFLLEAPAASDDGVGSSAGPVEVVLARRLSRTGRSRAYRDGEMVPAHVLESTVSGIVELVGQHDHLALARPSEARRLVDRHLTDEGRVALETYRAAWMDLRRLREAQATLGGDARSLNREVDLLRFQVDEIEKAGFEPGDDERLRFDISRLQHAEELGEGLGASREAVGEARDRLGEAVTRLRRLAELDAGLAELAETADGIEGALNDLLTDVGRAAEDVEHDPERLAELEARRAQLSELRRKYGDTLDAVLAYAADARARLEELEEALGRADRIDDDLRAAEARVAAAAEALRAARREAGTALAEEAHAHLLELGFTDPHLEVVVTEAEPGPEGADRVELRFASDRRLEPGPVGRVASGGELSRLVLALRIAGGAGDAPIVAFDEVDAGVGGATALALGRKLAALADDRQVLVVTHLPQVAAFADQHLVVRRDGSGAHVEEVDGVARLEELSRMLAGLPGSERGREHAEELLALAAEVRSERS